MGYTSTHREKGMTDREFFERELPCTLTQQGKILACATVGSVFYAAVQQSPDAEVQPGETWGFVAIIRRTRDYFNMTYKEMSDSMGPADDRCPVRILDLLTPTDTDWANDWRSRCRANADTAAKARKVTKGDVVRFAKPITFTNGETEDTFIFEQRSTFRGNNGGRFRITNWRTARTFEIVGA